MLCCWAELQCSSLAGMAEGDVLRANTGDELAEADDVMRCGIGCRGGSGRRDFSAADPFGGSRIGEESCKIRLVCKVVERTCPIA